MGIWFQRVTPPWGRKILAPTLTQKPGNGFPHPGCIQNALGFSIYQEGSLCGICEPPIGAE